MDRSASAWRLLVRLRLKNHFPKKSFRKSYFRKSYFRQVISVADA